MPFEYLYRGGVGLWHFFPIQLLSLTLSSCVLDCVDPATATDIPSYGIPYSDLADGDMAFAGESGFGGPWVPVSDDRLTISTKQINGLRGAQLQLQDEVELPPESLNMMSDAGEEHRHAFWIEGLDDKSDTEGTKESEGIQGDSVAIDHPSIDDANRNPRDSPALAIKTGHGASALATIIEDELHLPETFSAEYPKAPVSSIPATPVSSTPVVPVSSIVPTDSVSFAVTKPKPISSAKQQHLSILDTPDFSAGLSAAAPVTTVSTPKMVVPTPSPFWAALPYRTPKSIKDISPHVPHDGDNNTSSDEDSDHHKSAPNQVPDYDSDVLDKTMELLFERYGAVRVAGAFAQSLAKSSPASSEKDNAETLEVIKAFIQSQTRIKADKGHTDEADLSHSGGVGDSGSDDEAISGLKAAAAWFSGVGAGAGSGSAGPSGWSHWSNLCPGGPCFGVFPHTLWEFETSEPTQAAREAEPHHDCEGDHGHRHDCVSQIHLPHHGHGDHGHGHHHDKASPHKPCCAGCASHAGIGNPCGMGLVHGTHGASHRNVANCRGPTVSTPHRHTNGVRSIEGASDSISKTRALILNAVTAKGLGLGFLSRTPTPSQPGPRPDNHSHGHSEAASRTPQSQSSQVAGSSLEVGLWPGPIPCPQDESEDVGNLKGKIDSNSFLASTHATLSFAAWQYASGLLARVSQSAASTPSQSLPDQESPTPLCPSQRGSEAHWDINFKKFDLDYIPLLHIGRALESVRKLQKGPDSHQKSHEVPSVSPTARERGPGRRNPRVVKLRLGNSLGSGVKKVNIKKIKKSASAPKALAKPKLSAKQRILELKHLKQQAKSLNRGIQALYNDDCTRNAASSKRQKTGHDHDDGENGKTEPAVRTEQPQPGSEDGSIKHWHDTHSGNSCVCS